MRLGAVDPLPLVELVRGEIDAVLAESFHTWDHAPWVLIVEEAGGRFTDRTGGRASDQGGSLYSNTNLHSQLLASLRTRRIRVPDLEDDSRHGRAVAGLHRQKSMPHSPIYRTELAQLSGLTRACGGATHLPSTRTLASHLACAEQSIAGCYWSLARPRRRGVETWDKIVPIG